MEQVIFRGEVKEPGRFVAVDQVRFQGALRQRVGLKVEVVLREPSSPRSADQNAYWHAVPFRLIAQHTGADIADVKLALMGHKFGWVYSPLAGREVPIKPHTSDMTVAEADEFTEWLPAWALEHLGLVIPLPNEVATP